MKFLVKLGINLKLKLLTVQVRMASWSTMDHVTRLFSLNNICDGYELTNTRILLYYYIVRSEPGPLILFLDFPTQKIDTRPNKFSLQVEVSKLRIIAISFEISRF